MSYRSGNIPRDFAIRPRSGFGSASSRERRMAGGVNVGTLETVWLPAPCHAMPAPAVVLLHGGSGLFGDGDPMMPARALVAAGLSILLVRGLDGPSIDLEGQLSYAGPGADTRRVAGLLDEAAARAGLSHAAPFGLVGISTAGAVALELGASDSRVRAVAVCFAPPYADAAAKGANTPPTLLLHGSADATVPVERAAALEALLRTRGSPVERVEYVEEGHGFTGPAQLDAIARIAAFQQAHLRQA